jgi:hypothetical protein
MIIRSDGVEDGTFNPPLPENYISDFNPLDKFCRRHICDPCLKAFLRFRWFDSRKEAIRDALYALLVALADMLLATGNAMLIAAIIKLHRGSISIYHLSMVTNLAWFSSNVHLLALLGIRTKVNGSMKKERRWAPQARRGPDVIIRVILMLLLACLMLYCCYVSGAAEWYDHYDCPAQCALGKEKGGVPRQWMIVNFFLVIQGYSEHFLVLLCPSMCHWWIDKARHWIVDGKGCQQPPKKPWWKSVCTLPYYILTSETFQVLLDGFIWFALGVFWTFADRNDVHRYWRDISDEEDDIEGFGQLVPILLLGVPLLQALETYSGKLILWASRPLSVCEKKESDKSSLDSRKEEARAAQRNTLNQPVP